MSTGMALVPAQPTGWCPASVRAPTATGILALICLPVLAGCTPDAPPPAEIVVDSAGVRVVSIDPTGLDKTCTISQQPVLVIGDTEEDERYWFSEISGMGRLSDGSVAVVDGPSAEVRIYDEAGSHLRSMGRRGEGPGEFDHPFLLWIAAGDTLWVGDIYPWRYNLFTSLGSFVRQVNLTPVFPNIPMSGGVLDNGHTVNTRSESAYPRREDFAVSDTLVVEVHDPLGQRFGTLARMPDRTSGTVKEAPDLWLFPLFQSFADVDAAGSTIVLADGSNAELRVLDASLRLRTIIRWSEPDREVTDADVQAWRESYIERRSQPGAGDWSAYDDARISEDRPVADRFPAISTVMIGRDERIWVRRYDRPGERRGWLAFGPGGEFRCHLSQPPGSVWEFGGNHVLLLRETETGVQTVHMHRLEVPSASATAMTHSRVRS